MKFIERARRAFDAYCAMGEGELPADPISALQVRLHRLSPGREARVAAAYLVAEAAQLLAGAADLAAGLATTAEPPLAHGGNRALVALRVRVIAQGLMAICTAHRLDFAELVRDDPESR